MWLKDGNFYYLNKSEVQIQELNYHFEIPCHHVLANEIALNLKYRIGLKHFFNINLGIDIIKKTTFFICIFNIFPRVFTQILIERDRWMWN